MSDSEKIKLISQMISDFWEFNEAEDMRNGVVVNSDSHLHSCRDEGTEA